MKYCIKCGFAMQDDMRFCASCGYDSLQDHPVQSEVPAQHQAPSSTSIQVPTEQSNVSADRGKKKIFTVVFILIGIVIAVLIFSIILASLHKHRKNDSSAVDYSAPYSSGAADDEVEFETEDQAEIENETEPAEEQAGNLSVCLSAYKSFLTDFVKKNSDSIDEDGAFSLIYVDDDDTPELVVGAEHVHVSHAELFVFDDGSVKKIGEYGEFGQLEYLARKNTIISQYMGFGVSAKVVFSLEDSSAKEVISFREEPITMDSDTYNFFINDKKVSYSDYQSSYSKYIPMEPVLTPDMTNSSDPNVYPLNEEGIRKCFGSDSSQSSAGESHTARENSFSAQDGSLVYLMTFGFSRGAVDLLGDDYVLDYFYRGRYGGKPFGMDGEERMIYYPDHEKYGTIGLICGGDLPEDIEGRISGNEVIYGVMHDGEDVVTIDRDLTSDITYGELTERFHTQTKKDAETGFYVATFEYRGNDIYFAFLKQPSSSDKANSCWLYPHND